MSEAERYAKDRIEELTKNIAAALTPETLQAVVGDLIDNSPRPISDDVLLFAKRLAHQCECLIGDGPELSTCECGAEGVGILHKNGLCDVCNGVM